MILLHHEILGDPAAPTIVLGPSLGTTGAMWDSVAPALAEHFRVIRYDTRGHGGSPVPAGPYTLDNIGGDVLALLDHLGLDRVHFAGLSLGGMTGMWLAANAPERIDRLALLCTSARLGPPQMWTDRIAAVREGGVRAIADAGIERWFTSAFRERRPEVAAAFRDMLAATPTEGYAACCEAIRDMDLVESLPSITAPTLVVAGSDDPATPPSHAELIADAVPGSRLVVIPGAAHLASVEQPEAVLGYLVPHFSDPKSDTKDA